MSTDDLIREHLKELLGWNSAHVEYDRVVRNIPPKLRGASPGGVPYSLWQILEHVRLAQRDILDFCTNQDYTSPRWPADFWPSETSPPEREDWQQSIATYRRDRQSLIDLVVDPSIDLMDAIPHGDGQTYFRELILVADHTAYHIGQMVLIRRMLDIWPP